MKILVAEDEVNIAESYKLILEFKGHQVTITNDGEKCMNVYNEALVSTTSASSSPVSAFDLVILDYRMPKKDGIQVAQEILGMVPKQKILLATAYVQDISISRLHEIPATRAVELIQKPFDFDTFLQVVAGHGHHNGSSSENDVAPDNNANDSNNKVNSRSIEDNKASKTESVSLGSSQDISTYQNLMGIAVDRTYEPNDAFFQHHNGGSMFNDG